MDDRNGGGFRRRPGRRARMLVLACAAGIVGCRNVPVEQAAPPVQSLSASEADVARLESGRALYTSQAHCARCHRPKPVIEYTQEQWAGDILPRMAKKAKLTPPETQDVLSYVRATAARGSAVTVR